MPDTESSLICRSYRLRFTPTASQRVILAQCFGVSRFAYNTGLDALSFAYRTQGQSFSGYDCQKAFTELKKGPDYAWLKKTPTTVYENSFDNLNKAFTNFFAGRAKYPRFKKKLHKQTAKFALDQRQNNWLAGRMLKIQGLSEVNVNWSRVPSGRPKSVTVTKTSTGKYFVSFMCEESIEKYPSTGRSCGVDVGVKDLAIIQDWKSGAPRNTYENERDLRIAQRRFSRKTKGSKRWHHARIKVARIHERIANSRANFVHNVSSYIVKNHDAIAIETLNIKGMLKNRRLSKAISDAALGELHRQLEYKSQWYGREFGKCSQWEPTSKTCSDCGLINADLKLSDREWTCECGSTHDRDTNASINILNAVFGMGLELAGVEPVVDGGCNVAA